MAACTRSRNGCHNCFMHCSLLWFVKSISTSLTLSYAELCVAFFLSLRPLSSLLSSFSFPSIPSSSTLGWVLMANDIISCLCMQMRKWRDEKRKKKHKGLWRMHLEGKLLLPNAENSNCTARVVRCRLPSCFVRSMSMCAIPSRVTAVCRMPRGLGNTVETYDLLHNLKTDYYSK